MITFVESASVVHGVIVELWVECRDETPGNKNTDPITFKVLGNATGRGGTYEIAKADAYQNLCKVLA